METGSGESTSGWLLDEMAAIGRENLDAAHVSRYDDKEDADAANEVRLLQAEGLGPSSTVVDLGAGTGQFALAAATASFPPQTARLGLACRGHHRRMVSGSPLGEWAPRLRPACE